MVLPQGPFAVNWFFEGDSVLNKRQHPTLYRVLVLVRPDCRTEKINLGRGKQMKIRKTHSPDRILYGCAAGIWSVTALMALLLLTIFQRTTNYACRVDFLLPNSLLLLAGTGGLTLCSFGYLRFRDSLDRLARQHAEKYIRVLSIAVFFIQAYLFYNIYFLTGWDVRAVSNVAEHIAAGNREFWAGYYSQYPNNLAITWILADLFRINNILGNVEEPVYIVILFQCAASCIAGYLLFQVVKNMTKAAYGFCAWLVYILHVAFSPWLTIPYTDAMTLLIPISVLWLYQTAKTGKHPLVSWAGIGFMSAFGYRLKPQCAIILIAIILCEVIGILGKKPRWISRFKQLGGLLAGAAAALSLWSGILFPMLGITVNPEQTYGPSHFLMMGLNRVSCGVWSADDVAYSGSFSTAAERTAANLQVAKDRVQELGLSGLAEHIARKSLVNFGDGTYAWGVEGNFYSYVYPERNQFVSPFLRNIYYTTGEYYPYFGVFQQFLWIAILLCSVGMLLYLLTERERSAEVGVVALSLVGLVLFQTIFEARARYFFSYSPLFIIAAVFGWLGIVRFVRRNK